MFKSSSGTNIPELYQEFPSEKGSKQERHRGAAIKESRQLRRGAKMDKMSQTSLGEGMSLRSLTSLSRSHMGTQYKTQDSCGLGPRWSVVVKVASLCTYHTSLGEVCEVPYWWSKLAIVDANVDHHPTSPHHHCRQQPLHNHQIVALPYPQPHHSHNHLFCRPPL
ncbi:hypothetical protein ACSBR2_001609 [Camellia fascicularis]